MNKFDCDEAVAKKTCELGEFSVSLNGQQLDEQLNTFQKLCKEHAKHYRRRCRQRYYNLGLIAHLTNEITTEELHNLMVNGARTFFVDLVKANPSDVPQILNTLNTTKEQLQCEENFRNRLVIGLAFEIHGDNCRLGRMRNDQPVLMHCNDVMTLTTDDAYIYSGYKQISYVINLKYYFSKLNLCDELRLGQCVRVKIVKKLRFCIAVLVTFGGFLHSYDYIQLPDQCGALSDDAHLEMFEQDLLQAQELGGHFIVLPHMRCQRFVHSVRRYISQNNLKLEMMVGVDLQFLEQRARVLLEMMKELDYLWLPQVFFSPKETQDFLLRHVIPMMRCKKRPVIGLVPLQRCCDFRAFKNHLLMWKLDAMLIERSNYCQKYPLIVKKLLPIRNFRQALMEDPLQVKQLIASYPSIVEFIIRTITTIECQAILLHSRCEQAAIALSRLEIYCPVYIILSINDPENQEEINCIEKLARHYNLRRNLRTLIYTSEMNECGYSAIDYALLLLRRSCVLEVGDFVMTLELRKEDGEELIESVGTDVIILRAYYLPPLPIADRFKYAEPLRKGIKKLCF